MALEKYITMTETEVCLNCGHERNIHTYDKLLCLFIFNQFAKNRRESECDCGGWKE